MFFKDYFISIIDSLQADFEGNFRKAQNPADKGELCENFVKKFLEGFFSDNYKIFRGGKIVDCNNNESSQLDIILTAKNSLKIFGEKGIYPIESVYGVFSVTSTLNHKKFLSCLNEFKSIPNNEPEFIFLNSSNENYQRKLVTEWKKRFPFKCIFAFTGDICKDWEDELNNIVEKNPEEFNFLPDIIHVNKKGFIRKLYTKPTQLTTGKIIDKYFYYADNNLCGNQGAVIANILNELFILNTWQYSIIPNYPKYFNQDL